ncbi:PRC-barrel domain-containing protein [Rhizobium sp. ARZ01]|uniref:PRC-barrel domain-containing protein n=1 Tax=Rhizobium sp. ARZ01 TaxID=2769313 RepID=UPI00177EA898|nr:PRC-barrel domain-containing protein [Rhizobium sp. ARZ01]MBD9371812.1 PRC-barrel domain-containing protein [Rhizobium sp. ARZ01]
MRHFLIALAATTMIGGAAYAQTAQTTTTETFVTVQPTDVLSYNLIGLNVTNDAAETIGEIKDLVIAEGRLSGYIVSVGGFLGMGDHYVMVGPSAVKVTYLENDKKWTAVMNATKEELQKAPEFKYEGRWER